MTTQRFEKPSPRSVATEHSASAERHSKLQSLLVPVDFTLATLPALHFAGRLAERFDSTICLLHVLESHPLAMGRAAVMLTKLDEEIVHDTVEQLNRLARDELAPSLAGGSKVRRAGDHRQSQSTTGH